MQNILKKELLVDIGEHARRQYIDAVSTFRAYEDAVKAAKEVRGGMLWRNQNGTDYLVRTSTGNSQTGLGARSVDTEAIYNKFVAAKAEVESRLSDIKVSLDRHQKLNRVLHVGRAPTLLVDILNMLAEHGLESHFTVVGTHAIYAYESAAGVRVESAEAMATIDVDFLWDTRKRISFISQMTKLNSSMIGMLQKVDKTFKIRNDQKYTAVNSSGFEVDIIRRSSNKNGVDVDPNPLKTTASDDDFWVTQATKADVLLSGHKFDAVIMSTSGYMARMHTISPIAFVKFKRWMSKQPDRNPLKAPRDAMQAEIIETLAAEYLPHITS